MLRSLVLAVVATGSTASVDGGWLDPKFAKEGTQAGLRYIGTDSVSTLDETKAIWAACKKNEWWQFWRIPTECPDAVHAMVGTNSGNGWTTIMGQSFGDKIVFDYSSIGGFPYETGKYAKSEDGEETITWVNDGSVWTKLKASERGEPAGPRPNMLRQENHDGVYTDPNHYRGAGSFSGIRVISENPPHHLKMVGNDGGDKWWVLKGTCAGERMSHLQFDFSPKLRKGYTGVLQHFKGEYTHDGVKKDTIHWQDRNVWTKAYIHTVEKPEPPAPAPAQAGANGGAEGANGGAEGDNGADDEAAEGADGADEAADDAASPSDLAAASPALSSGSGSLVLAKGLLLVAGVAAAASGALRRRPLAEQEQRPEREL